MNPNWLVWTPDDGVLRRERTRNLGMHWWLGLLGEGVIRTGGQRFADGVYQVVAKRPHDPPGSLQRAWIVRADIPEAVRDKYLPAPLNPKQPPLYPHTEQARQFTQVPR